MVEEEDVRDAEARVRAVLAAERAHYGFGTPEANSESFGRWRRYYQAALDLARFSAEESAALLRRVQAQKAAFLDSIDFYVPEGQEQRHPCYLEGIWQQVAWFDAGERAGLLAAYAGTAAASPVAPDARKAQEWAALAPLLPNP